MRACRMSDPKTINYVKSVSAAIWRPNDVLLVGATMMTPDWFNKNAEDGWLRSRVYGDVFVNFTIYPKLSQFYKYSIDDLINIIWDGGLRPACDRLFCCCEYATTGFPGYEKNINEISPHPITNMDTYISGPIEIEVFEDYWQQKYIRDIRFVSMHFGVPFEDVFQENGYERRRKCMTSGCAILFKGERYKVTQNGDIRKNEVEIIPPGVTWP